MNICCFSRVNYWQGIEGGMDLHGKLLSEGMVNRGHNVSIISTRHPNGMEYEERNGVKIYYLKNTVFGSRRKGWRKESVDKFFRLNYERPFDVIWSQSFDAFGLFPFQHYSLNVPIVAILHGCMQQELTNFLANIYNNLKKPKEMTKAFARLFFSYLWVQRKLINISDKIITVSNEASRSFEKWYGTNYSNKCITIVNGVDTSIFYPQQKYRAVIRNRYGVDEKNVLLMTIGRITKAKGFHVALKALRHLIIQGMNVKLIVVGTGDYLQQLQKMVYKIRLQEHVIFAGLIENNRITEYYNGADIVLNPSLTAEGSSYVVLEAMACGKLVIASRVGGIKSIIVDGKNGLLVNPGFESELSNKIRLLINNKSLAKRLSEAARRSILKKFDIDRMVDDTLTVMKKVADGLF